MRNIRVSIQKPCAENWSNFSAAEKGRFCQQCSKVVVDFTTMSDLRLAQYLQQSQTSMCGRLRADQFKEFPLQKSSYIRPGFSLLKAGVLGLFLLLTDRSAMAKGSPPPHPQVVMVSEQAESMSTTAVDFLVKGAVTSGEDSLALPGVNVLLKGTNIGTVTDMDGKFEFPVRLKVGDVLVFSFIGFATQEFTIQSSQSPTISLAIDVTMECEVVFMGQVLVDEVYAEKKGISKLWSRIKDIF